MAAVMRLRGGFVSSCYKLFGSVLSREGTYLGELVRPGTILARQRGPFKWHPGQNVQAGKDRTLFALREGFVKYTNELFEPYPSKDVDKDAYHERKFINVISANSQPVKFVRVKDS